jgi:RNA recognition motif-containing protein
VKIDRATGRSRGFGFVEFGTVEACRKALNDREQSIKGKNCEIKPVGFKSVL